MWEVPINFTIAVQPNSASGKLLRVLANICSGESVSLAITDGKIGKWNNSLFRGVEIIQPTLQVSIVGSSNSINGILNNVSSQTQITAFFCHGLHPQFGCSDMGNSKSFSPHLRFQFRFRVIPFFCGNREYLTEVRH